MRIGENRDKKTSFSASGTRNIWWIVQHFSYTPNFWTSVTKEQRERIMSPRGGTERLTELFERHTETPVSRVLIEGVRLFV
ncbi:MAG: hypothetical protein HC788_09900 [Sphingopyxis sp.]|nr:hypothetical protein [Sphingopyxis sp.]